MELMTIKTPPLYPGDDLLSILKTCLPPLNEGDVLVITSKIISMWENNGVILSKDKVQDKNALIAHESQCYLPPTQDVKHPFCLTMTHNILIPSAGIDESNGDGAYILYPKNPFEAAARLWSFLRSTWHLNTVGVIISDSHTTPLRRGVVGIALSWCGFEAIMSYKGQPDCFGRPLAFTSRNNVDGLASSAVFMMGEGNEQTPLCVIKNAPRLVFQEHPPTLQEINNFCIPMEEDLYAPLLQGVAWKKGGDRGGV